VQGVGVTSERAFLDQVAVEGGEVEVWIGILGVDVDLVAAVVEVGTVKQSAQQKPSERRGSRSGGEGVVSCRAGQAECASWPISDIETGG
jgi:hypothetical protein